MAKKYRRPCLHLDMGKLSIDASARMLRSWVVEHRIEMLNVAGPRLSGDTTIYRTTFEILEAAFV